MCAHCPTSYGRARTRIAATTRAATIRLRVTRILFVEHNTDGTVGGSHYALLEICRAIDRQRYQPIVLFYQEHSLVDAFRATGADVVVGLPVAGAVRISDDVPLPPPLRGAVQAGYNAIRLFTVRPLRWIRVLRRLQADVVHLNNSFNGDQDVVLAARALGLPCFAHQRGVPGITGRLELMFSRCFDQIVAISTMIRDDLLTRGVDASRIRLIHDGIEPERVVVRRTEADLKQQLGIPAGDQVIGIVGNVKRWKGQHVVVEALARIAKERPGVHAVIVGALADHAFVQELRERVRRHGLDDRVHLVGFDANPADYMAVMDVVVHASIEPEPFGLVNLEAMALGRPLISTTIGGPRDVVVDGQTGFLCPPGDDAAVASRVLELLADPTRARLMGAAGRRRLEAHFTAERNIRAIESMYADVLHR